LRERPTEVTSIRALIALANTHGREELAQVGIALLRALGDAAPSERDQAQAIVPPRRRRTDPHFDDPLHEQLCSALREVAAVVASEGLEAAAKHADTNPAVARDDVEHFARELLQSEIEVAGSVVSHRSADELRSFFIALAAVSDGQSDAEAAGDAVAALEHDLGRWSRRKVRRALEGISIDAIADCDFEAWRGQFELRTALLALCDRPTPLAACEGADLRALVEGSTAARTLLVRIVSRWSDAIRADD
jgi:hypothetical protein